MTAPTTSVAESIRRGLQEALAYANGAADKGLYKAHIPAKLDVEANRDRIESRPLGLSQSYKLL